MNIIFYGILKGKRNDKQRGKMKGNNGTGNNMRINKSIEDFLSFEQLYSMNFNYSGQLHAGDMVLQNSGSSMICRESFARRGVDVDVVWNKGVKTTYEQLRIPYPEFVVEYMASKYQR